MSNISYTWSIDLRKLLSALSPNQQKTVSRRGLNRAAQTMRKIAVKGATSTYRVTAATVRKSISLRQSDSLAEFTVRSKRIGGEHFKYVPGRSGRRHSPLKLSVRKDTPLKALPRAFIMQKTGAMFRRRSELRKDIERVNSLSVTHMIAHNDALIEEMKAGAADTFKKVLEHELKRALGR